jgi:uncharacterized protein YdcH (DUF465 family)
MGEPEELIVAAASQVPHLVSPAKPMPQVLPREVHMPDPEPLIERLSADNHEFRKLREEHKKYEEELMGLNGRGFLSADQHWRVSELKKLKLIAKDRMEAMVRQYRASAHA